MFDLLNAGEYLLFHETLCRGGDHLMLLSKILGSENILRLACADQKFPTLESCFALGFHESLLWRLAFADPTF